MSTTPEPSLRPDPAAGNSLDRFSDDQLLEAALWVEDSVIRLVQQNPSGKLARRLFLLHDRLGPDLQKAVSTATAQSV